MSAAYYNEHDPFCCDWLRNLITAGHIAPGDVDERSILDVQPEDLRGYTQWHLFAGIAIWSYSLGQAGWTDDRSVMSLSCPCQPWSAAGQQKGHADERHLWPHAFRLIETLRPPVIFGEQVASKVALSWYDGVKTDLNSIGYSLFGIDIPAAAFGAPHIRSRLYFVGERND